MCDHPIEIYEDVLSYDSISAKRLSPCMKSLKWKLQRPTSLWYCFKRFSPSMTNVWQFNWTLRRRTFLWTIESVLLFQSCESVEEFLNVWLIQMKATKAYVYIVLLKIFWACVWNPKCVTRKKERYTDLLSCDTVSKFDTVSEFQNVWPFN